MNPVSTERLIHLIQDALTHSDDLQHERLKPFVSDFQTTASELGAALGPGLQQDGELQRLQTVVRETDVQHDDAHRALHLLLSAFAAHGPAAERGIVRAALALLWPDGLGAAVQAGYAEEAGAAEGFAERLRQPEVVAAFTSVAREVPAATAWGEAIVAAGRALGQALQAMDAHVAARTARGASPAAGEFRTRNRARKLWSLYLATIDHALPAHDPAAVPARDRLLQTWRREVLGETPSPRTAPEVARR